MATRKKYSLVNAAISFIPAALALPLVFGLASQTFELLYIVFVVVMFHMVFAVPAIYILNYVQKVTIWTCAALGFIIGALPMGVTLFPQTPRLGSSASVNGVATVVDGTRTLAGWINYGEMVALFGGFGVITAIVFCLCLKWLSREDQSKTQA